MCALVDLSTPYILFDFLSIFIYDSYGLRRGPHYTSWMVWHKHSSLNPIDRLIISLRGLLILVPKP